MGVAPGINGVDDLLAAVGPDAVLAQISKAKFCRPLRRRSGIHEVSAGPSAGGLDLWQFPKTDFGFAERLVLMHGAEIRYCHAWGEWLIWDGEGRWKIDYSAQILQLVKSLTRAMFASAAKIENGNERDAALAYSRDCEKSNRITGMLKLAASEVPVLPEQLDAEQWLLNCQNGTIDLRTGQLREHRREDLITKQCPVEYDPAATCPTWERFQERVTNGRPELIRYKQQFSGYALTGVVIEKRSLAMNHGGGNNGKTTEIEQERYMRGDYAGQIRIESLMEQKNRNGSGPSPDIADLRGKRYVASSEPGEGVRLSESTLKYIMSMGTVKARHLNREHFEFPQTWKLLMDCNHKPVIRGTDSAIWNRIALIPFDVTIPDEEIDRELPAKLRAESPGILAWAVRGCLDWQANGLCVPEAVKDATAEYRGDMDVIGRYLSECCVTLPNASARAQVLYMNYTKWCADSGETPLNAMNFGTRLTEKGFRKEHDYKGVKYNGIGVRSND